MEPEVLGHAARTGQRLHPLSPVFEIGRSFLTFVVPGLLVLLLAAGDEYEVWYMLAFVPAVAVSLKRFLTLRYELQAEHLVVREGILFKRVRHIPYGRIQNIDTVQNPLHRLCRVAEVRLETASGQEPEAVLRVLSLAQLDEIREGVFRGRRRVAAREDPDTATAASTGDATPAGPAPFLRLEPADLVWFGLLSQKGIAFLSGLLFLVWELGLEERLKRLLDIDPEEAVASLTPALGVALGLALLGVLQALTVLWSFVTLHDFKIARQGEDLRTSCGLWTRQTATLPRHRIQFLQVRESFLQRRLGRLSLRALTAGADANESSPVSRRWLVPLVRREALARILEQVQPATSLDGLPWRAVDPRARARLFKRTLFLCAIPCAASIPQLGAWSGLLALGGMLLAWFYASRRARRLAYARTPTGIVVRDGALTQVRNAVLYSRIQSVSLTQTPFDRRHRMAAVRIDTAGRADASLSFTIPYLDLVTARRLERELRRRAAGTEFRW